MIQTPTESQECHSTKLTFTSQQCCNEACRVVWWFWSTTGILAPAKRLDKLLVHGQLIWLWLHDMVKAQYFLMEVSAKVFDWPKAHTKALSDPFELCKPSTSKINELSLSITIYLGLCVNFYTIKLMFRIRSMCRRHISYIISSKILKAAYSHVF